MYMYNIIIIIVSWELCRILTIMSAWLIIAHR